MAFEKFKTEHSGAKNGGGGWGPRTDVKAASRKKRRTLDKKAVKGDKG